ncbi:MAG: hypothetical protein A2004_08085 [Spirochaetes bacterium GWC1_61_12]|nr:MAG: hypothetical protein A2Y37_06495 [Spirochaetes bacterium GWB1_60_80]OHD30482.1 MAG: hypothetical protein A2004_08085 [Spirochaetes bacterium GWC1_61_12]OHD44434.1 MAG: hypothetical protein A2Y35_09980 [Spirochaetes bacterium GWE1_60_18]OHD60832.1 MAG: hypothetical protein A2Y32_11515 [Spirochaetes bacterium GWF1_60_12]HAW86609.1 hypothetical protein [Spirochaetaceae bacterium]
MIQVRICCGLECAARGGQELIQAMETDPVLRAMVAVSYEQCLNSCQNGDFAPVIIIEGKRYTSMTSEKLVDLLHDMVTVPAGEGQR